MDYNKNYYQELGLDKNASDDDIKKSYRKLAHQYHPDKNAGHKDAESKFQRINEANQILSDSKSKQEYDQRSQHGNAYSPFNSNSFEFHFGNDDFFSQFFGGNSPFGSGGFNPFDPFNRQVRENLDINFNVNINLKQVYLNEKLEIKYKRNVWCENCAEKIELKDAEVTLQNLYQIRQSFRNMQRGYGHQSKHYKEKQGSLVLNINLERNDEYQIMNNYELHRVIDVHFQDAIDGVEFLYTHIDDTKIKIKLPTKSKNNDILKVKEKGLLLNENDRSDLFLKINIIIDYDRI
jgi:DnaJ-class molecular chaperone